MIQFGILYKNQDALLFKRWMEGDFVPDTMILTDMDNEVVSQFNDTSIAIIELKEVQDGITFMIRGQIEMDIDLASRHIHTLDELEDFDDMIESVVRTFRQNYGEHYGYTIH